MPGLIINTGSGAIGISGSPPEPVGLIEAVATGTTTVQVSWTDDATPEAPSRTFLVERSTDGESWTEIGTPTASPFNDTGRTAGTLYHYQVTARNFWGSAAPRSTTVTTQSEGAPDAPSSLSGTPISSSAISWNWTDNADNETAVDFQIDDNDSFTSPTDVELSAGSTTTTSSGLTPETTYYARVRSTNGSGDSSWSNTASATTPEAGEAEFDWTPVTDATLASDLTAWQAAEQTRMGNSSTLWLWAVQPYDWDDSGYPSLVIATHHDNGGVAIWRNNCATPGGTISFTRALPGELGTAESYDLGHIAGSVPIHDHDGDGLIDVNPIFKGSATDHELWKLNGDGELEATGNNWSGRGTYIYRYVPNGDNPPTIEIQWWTKPVTALDQGARHTFAWNGSGYTHSEASIPIPTGVDSGVLDDVIAACVAAEANSGVEASVHYTRMDLDSDGTDDLIIGVFAAYAGSANLHKGWYLKNNGDGTYTDKTTDWGLPNTGWPIILEQRMGPMIWPYEGAESLHRKIDGTGAMHLFVGGGGSSTCGVYKWTGSGYTRQTGPLTTQMAGQDNYPMQLWALPLKNQEDGYDLIYRRPRLSFVQIFLNDGTGTLAQWIENSKGGSQKYHLTWDPWGFIPQDLDNDGKIDLILGGNGGADQGVSGRIAHWLTVFRNATTNAGNYLKVKLNRGSGGNCYGAGGFVSVYAPGTSDLIVTLMARPDGLPIHFGLGSRATVDLVVDWHDGETSTIDGVSVNQTITVSEVDG